MKSIDSRHNAPNKPNEWAKSFNEHDSLPPVWVENLSQLVQQWRADSSPYDSDVQYQAFFESLARGLFRLQPRHILLCREKGVGDRAVMLEFARQVLNKRFANLTETQIFRLDCSLAWADQSLEVLLPIFSSNFNHPNHALIFDGIATLIASDAQKIGRSNVMSVLAHSQSRCIITITPSEYEDLFAGRPETDENFTTIELHEPTVETAFSIVRHFAKGLSDQYSIEIDDLAINKAVKLSHSYIPSKRLPSKAVRILTDVCESIAFDRLQGTNTNARIEIEDVVKRVSDNTGIPASTLSGLPDGIDYFQSLKSRVFGQDDVIAEVATELGLIRAGMTDPGKPASVMLFVGQTGTGKTELAKVIAKLYSASKRLKTFTLGNFSEPHSVSGLIGVPPGYVGHEQGGRLINELNTDAYSVFLLDEADKAHPDVMQPFLNLFDEGWIVDQRGVKAIGERAIFILTTNVGQRQIVEMQKKGKSWDEIQAKLLETLSQIRHVKANRPVFSAELLARIKRVVIFRPLEAEAFSSITQLLCRDLVTKWKQERQRELLIESNLIDRIAELAHALNEKSKGKEGGRIVRKLIANHIEAPIQSSIGLNLNSYGRSTVVHVALQDSEGLGVVVSFR